MVCLAGVRNSFTNRFVGFDLVHAFKISSLTFRPHNLTITSQRPSRWFLGSLLLRRRATEISTGEIFTFKTSEPILHTSWGQFFMFEMGGCLSRTIKVCPVVHKRRSRLYFLPACCFKICIFVSNFKIFTYFSSRT